jgi:hypothetical protein
MQKDLVPLKSCWLQAVANFLWFQENKIHFLFSAANDEITQSFAAEPLPSKLNRQKKLARERARLIILITVKLIYDPRERARLTAR